MSIPHEHATALMDSMDRFVAQYDAWRKLAVELGMPRDAETRRLVFDGAVYGKAWQEYSVEQFGILVPELPHPCPWPYARQVSGDRPELIVQVWLRRIRLNGSPAYIEARWHPERGETIALVGLESVGSMRCATQTLGGLKLLKRVDKRGRKPGRNWTDAEFRDRLRHAYDELAAIYGDDPSQQEIADNMGMSRASFGRYLESCGICWHDFKANSRHL